MTDSQRPLVSIIGMESVIIVVDGVALLIAGLAGAQKAGQLAGAKNQ